MAPPSPRTGLLLGFAAYACWGLLSPVGDHLLDRGFEPLGLNAVRFTIAAALLLAFLGPDGTRSSLQALRRPGILWANLLANVSLTAFLFSLLRVEPTQATLLFYSAPLWTAAWARLRLGERLGLGFAPAVAGLLAGGYLALFGAALPGAFDLWGAAFGAASAVLWAFYTVALRRVAPDLDVKPLLGSAFISGAAYFVVLALLFEGPPALGWLGVADWAWLALYVAVPSLGSFVLFSLAIKYAPAAQVNILVAAELAFTALFAAALFGARFTWLQVAGLALAIGSVAAYLAVRARVGPDPAAPSSGETPPEATP